MSAASAGALHRGVRSPPLRGALDARGDVVEVVGSPLGEVARDEDAVVAVAADLVVVDLRGPVDVAERHVDLAQQQVLVVRGVGVEVADDLEGPRAHGEALVDDELVGRLEEEPLHLTAR